MKIAIAGASGFVGRRLVDALLGAGHDVIAFSRKAQAPIAARPGAGVVEWRACDLYSLLQAEQALAGAEVAFYLVHSMLPAARLTQSSFEDIDLLLADNFARAAQAAGIKRIIYLGGLIPEGTELSSHLRSRLEVERALASRGADVTALRAGLVLGAEGSSFQMLYLLVKRLPVMICPRWTRSRTQCIDARDVVALLRFCLEHPAETARQTFDIGGPEVLTYRDLMAATARELGVHRRFFSVPLFTPGLSRLWIQLVTGASGKLVGPLVQSLRHEMLVRDGSLLALYGKPLLSVRDSLRDALAGIRPRLRAETRQRQRALRGPSEVRSIMRLPATPGHDTGWIAREYMDYVPKLFGPLIRARRIGDDTWALELAGFGLSLLNLRLAPARSGSDRQLFYIVGGLLSRTPQNPHARLEFRELPGMNLSLSAIHDFRPSLPWPIYAATQTWVHLWVMGCFSRHLAQVAARQPGSST